MLIQHRKRSGNLYLSVWLGVDLKMDTKKTCSKEIGLHAKNMLTIIGSIVNII